MSESYITCQWPLIGFGACERLVLVYLYKKRNSTLGSIQVLSMPVVNIYICTVLVKFKPCNAMVWSQAEVGLMLMPILIS